MLLKLHNDAYAELETYFDILKVLTTKCLS